MGRSQQPKAKSTTTRSSIRKPSTRKAATKAKTPSRGQIPSAEGANQSTLPSAQVHQPVISDNDSSQQGDNIDTTPNNALNTASIMQTMAQCASQTMQCVQQVSALVQSISATTQLPPGTYSTLASCNNTPQQGQTPTMTVTGGPSATSTQATLHQTDSDQFNQQVAMDSTPNLTHSITPGNTATGETNLMNNVTSVQNLHASHIATPPLTSPTYTNTPSLVMKPCPVRDSAGLPCGGNVPLNIKQKIWSRKYVDVASLNTDYKRQTPETYAVQMQVDPITGMPTFHQIPTTNQKAVKQGSDPWIEWTKGWKKFASVYVEKYPDEVQDLFTYELKLTNMYTLGANWQYYDTEFRKDQEFAQYSFLTHRSDLYSTATAVLTPPRPFLAPANTGQPFRPGTQGQRASTPNNVPSSYCYAFHLPGQRCEANPCTYKHICFKCNSSKAHPAFLCKKGINNSNSSNNSSDKKQSQTPNTSKRK